MPLRIEMAMLLIAALLSACFPPAHSQCPVGYFSSSADSTCSLCKGYEPVTGKRDGVAHSGRRAKPYADVGAATWDEDNGAGELLQHVFNKSRAPICGKGEWLLDECLGVATEAGNFSFAEADNSCQACTPKAGETKPANSHYDFPVNAFANSCPWTCNQGYTNWKLDRFENKLHQNCGGPDHNTCECLLCTAKLCDFGYMRQACTPTLDAHCVDCFGYEGGRLKGRDFCGRGHFLHDFCVRNQGVYGVEGNFNRS